MTYSSSITDAEWEILAPQRSHSFDSFMKRKFWKRYLVKWLVAVLMILIGIIPARLAIAFYHVLGSDSQRMEFAAKF